MEFESVELKFSGNFVIGQSILLCPQCNFEYLHIISVSIHRGDDKITISADEVSIINEKNMTRGVTVSIEYSGECGHHGLIIFHFYKGNIETYHQSLPEPPQPMESKDLFRD